MGPDVLRPVYGSDGRCGRGAYCLRYKLDIDDLVLVVPSKNTGRRVKVCA